MIALQERHVYTNAWHFSAIKHAGKNAHTHTRADALKEAGADEDAQTAACWREEGRERNASKGMTGSEGPHVQK